MPGQRALTLVPALMAGAALTVIYYFFGGQFLAFGEISSSPPPISTGPRCSPLSDSLSRCMCSVGFGTENYLRARFAQPLCALTISPLNVM